MTGKEGFGNPPANTQFKRGISGNPRGRPRKERPPQEPDNPLALILSKTFKSRKGGVERLLSTKEILQTNAYNRAIKGDPRAIRRVFGWIKARRNHCEKERRKHISPRGKSAIETVDPRNADAALQLLEIICVPDDFGTSDANEPQYQMQAWAVQAALSRHGGSRRVTDGDLPWILAYTRDGASVKLPRGYRNGK